MSDVHGHISLNCPPLSLFTLLSLLILINLTLFLVITMYCADVHVKIDFIEIQSTIFSFVLAITFSQLSMKANKYTEYNKHRV